MNSNPIVYLAGPVQHVADGGADWRDELQSVWGDRFEFKNPLAKYNVPVENLTVVDGLNSDGDDEVSVGEIVRGDKRLIYESDAILIGYSDIQSIGTPMEAMFGYERHYPIAIWIRDDTDADDLSPWYRYHADTITANLDVALASIRRSVDPTDE